MIRIGIIVGDSIQRIGLQFVIREYFPDIDIVDLDFSEMILNDECDLFLVDSLSYIVEHEFFMFRTNRCAIVVSGGNLISHNTLSLRIINSQSPLVQIVDEISQFVNSLEKPSKNTDVTENDLSAREIQVLTHIVSGAINKEIASELGISLNTVLTHRKNITAKLGIKTVSGLTLYALMHGYIKS